MYILYNMSSCSFEIPNGLGKQHPYPPALVLVPMHHRRGAENSAVGLAEALAASVVCWTDHPI
jgi:hypothetical protein